MVQAWATHISASRAESLPWGRASWRQRASSSEAGQRQQPGHGDDVSYWMEKVFRDVDTPFTPPECQSNLLHPRQISEVVQLQIPGTKKQIGNIVSKKDFNKD